MKDLSEAFPDNQNNDILIKNSQTAALQRALTCFQLPVVWLAIGLLLVNDHILKHTIPSWFTGKLSDFAGLFFFPLLLATLMLPIGMKLKRSFHVVGGAAFLITAVWFTLMKTNIPVNAATISIWESITATTAKIVLDPTDLIALIVLWPSWRIWSRAPHPRWQIQNERLRKSLSIIAIGISLFATLATSCDEPSFAFRFVVVDNQVYLGKSAWSSRNKVSQVYICNNSFNCARQLETVPDEVWQAFDQPASQSDAVCMPENPNHCFRAGNEQIEQSTDGGQTWRIAWQIPPGRRQFMQRVNKGGACPSNIEMGPYDLIIVPTGDNEFSVLAAMGNEGILVRSPAGSWERKTAYDSHPTPYKANNFFVAHILVVNEFLLWLVVWVAIIIVIFWLNWPNKKKATAFFSLAAVTIIAIGLMLKISIVFLYLILLIAYLLVFILYLSFCVIVIRMAIWWLQSDEERRKRKAFYFWLLSAIVAWTAFSPILLWAFALISSYTLAVQLSKILIIASIMIGIISWFVGQKQTNIIQTEGD